MQHKISKINESFRYVRKISAVIIFIFLFPVYLFLYGLKFGLNLLGVERLSSETLLHCMPFITFIFVTIFLFNASFWLGFFSEDSDNSRLSLPDNDIKMDE